MLAIAFANDLDQYGPSSFVVKVLYLVGPNNAKNHSLAQKYEEHLLSKQDYAFLYNYYTKNPRHQNKREKQDAIVANTLK